MDEQELLKERFKSAVSSTVKAISENFDLQIKFGSTGTVTVLLWPTKSSGNSHIVWRKPSR